MAKILVIDDEDLIRRTMRQSLENAGHTVIDAANGREGITRFDAEGADLVITDIIMPEQEGVETIIQLRRAHPDLPIIAVSGGGRLGIVDYLGLARRFGATQVLQKPFSQKELVGVVGEVIAGCS